jgi:serine/threonine protein kinase
MLESCPTCGKELDVTEFEPFTNVICPKCHTETRVKRQLGKYHLNQRHAVGGMSVVYLAEDTTLERAVAVKVLNQKYSSDETRVAAFETEARLTAAVNHPNVVRIFTVGRHFNRFYLVMELIDGESFEKMMSKNGALPESVVLDIALEVAEGLRAANDAGVLHRDVKPGNILLTKDGHAKLVDFGLALITQGGSAQAEEIWATPYYVPPEALSKGEEDFRSDLYAFGATLYHALYGKPPFESTSNATKVLRRAKQTIPRIGKVAPWLCQETCLAIDRMMAYQPKHRWGSYREVIEILSKARENASEKLPAPQREKRSRRRPKRKSFAILGVSGALFISLVTSLWIAPQWSSREAHGRVKQSPAIEVNPVDLSQNAPIFDPKKELQEQWASARKHLSEGKFEESHRQFTALLESSLLDKGTRYFIRAEAQLALLMNGQPARARKAAQSLHRDLRQSQHDDENTQRLARAMASLMKVVQPNPSLIVTDSTDITTTLTSLALSLKCWEHGLHTEATRHFQSLSQSKITGEHPWFQSYQLALKPYLADGALLTELEETSRPSDLAETLTLLQKVVEFSEKIQTPGRAPETLNARRVFLHRLKKGFELRPYSLPHLDWQALVGILEKRCREKRFQDAKGLLSNPVARKHPEALQAWNYLLNHALSESATNIEYQISFAWLTGNTDKAEELAAQYAAENEVFRRQWREVIIGLSQ